MREAMKRMIIRYLNEAINTTPKPTTEDVECMADHFVDDVARLLSARRDFKEE